MAKLEQLVAPPREHAAGGCDGGRMERAGGDADDLLPLEQKHAARLGFHQAVVRLSDPIGHSAVRIVRARARRSVSEQKGSEREEAG